MVYLINNNQQQIIKHHKKETHKQFSWGIIFCQCNYVFCHFIIYILFIYNKIMDNDILVLTQPLKILNKNIPTEEHPKNLSLQQFQNISLRNLKDKKKETDKTIEAVTARINYIKLKENDSAKKMYQIRKRMTDVQRVKGKTIEFKQQKEEIKKKDQQEFEKRLEFNKLLKQHLQCNKKIVFFLHKDKIQENCRKVRFKKNQNYVLLNYMRQTLAQQNLGKVNKIRQDELILQNRKKQYFLEKLKAVEEIKDSKLKRESKLKQTQQEKLQDLAGKQAVLQQKLQLSERFKTKCEQQYLRAKQKYKEFYQTTIRFSKKSSGRQSVFSSHSVRDVKDQSKCQIFIS